MKNIEKFRSVLDAEALDGLLLTSRVHRFYCVEHDIAEGIMLLTRENCLYFTDSRYIEDAERHLQDAQPVLTTGEHPMEQLLKRAVQQEKLQVLGYEERALTVKEFEQFEALLQTQWKPCQRRLEAFRAAKEPWELERMRKAQQITDQAFSELLAVIQPGITEKQLAAELIYRLYKFGGEMLSFDPIVVSGPNTSMPHGVPGDRMLQKGDFVTMDFGCKYQGYCSDMTRTVALGSVTEQMREVYETVARAQLAGIAATKAEKQGKEIDAAARQVIADAGYGACFGHGYGHSLGLEIHEAPNCNLAGTTPMPVHAVCSAEPGIYLPGQFGVRIEDVVVFEPDGCTVLANSPKELLIL